MRQPGTVYWYKPCKAFKFSEFMDELENQGFVSAYHFDRGCQRGAEPKPTLWWMKKINTTYHIDYTFVSRPESIQSVALGSHEDWHSYSDHSPIVTTRR